MIEEFDDAFGGEYLNEEGTFLFTIKSAELTQSKKGDAMVQLEVTSDHGSSTLYHVLSEKAKWSYKKLVAICFGFKNSQELKDAGFKKDLEVVHKELIGKKFLGVVEAENYVKEVKKANDDGTYSTIEEDRTSYKIKEYKAV